jgi:hypothetical protein
MCWSVQRDLLRLRVADLGDGPFERELDVVASVCRWAMCAVCVEPSDDGDDVGPRMERELGDRLSLATDSLSRPRAGTGQQRQRGCGDR